MVLEVLVLLSLAAAACAQCGMNSPCKPLRGGNQPYQLPEQVQSTAGYLSTSLTVDINEYTLDWLTVQRRLYNGMFTGPTIRIRPGDRLDLKLINNLAVADHPTSDEMNIFQFPNTTNLHTHGLHISSKDPQDNPFVRVPAGGAHQYRYEIDPDQPAGTYWYHPHRHGSVHFQLLGGMAGMLVVEDDPNDGELSAVSCPNNCEHEVQVTFQLLSYSDDDDAAFSLVQKEIGDYDGFRLNKYRLDDTSQYENLEQWAEDPDNAMRYMLVNGQLQPTMDLAVGQMKRFRFVNAGGVHGLALHISSGACRVREIAVDGVYLPRPRRAGRSFLVTGGRLDWLVICDRAGTYELRSDFIVDDGYDVTSLGDHPMYNGLLMTLNVAGGKFPRRLPNLPHFLSDLQNIREERIAGRFGIEVTPTDSMNREDFSMNHRYKAEVGTIQEWHFTNTEFESSHPIHTHVNHMQVISYNPYTGPVGVDDGEGNWKFFAQDGESCYYQHPKYNNSHRIEFPHEALAHMRHDVASKQKPSSIGYAKVGEWRDTLLVPPLANITVRFRADKYTGNVVTHCHLTNDEDKGMMMLTEIVPKGRATAVRESYDVRGPRHARTSYGGKSGSCQ